MIGQGRGWLLNGTHDVLSVDDGPGPDGLRPLRVVAAPVHAAPRNPGGGGGRRGPGAKKAKGKGARGKGPRRKDWYGLLVRYEPPEGQAVELGVATRRPMSSFKLGDKVEVLFNPAKPDLAVFPDENVMVGPMLVAGMGLFIVIVFLSIT
ncbi:MAG TPA: DUF3592 domain-containing protein [Archangium sp.]|nr:DUF3592 domain-containing protein [Archangium sp.]